MLDRKESPELQEIHNIHFVEPIQRDLTQNTSLFLMDKVKDDTVRIEFHFNAGQISGKRNMATFVSALLLSGTKDKTSEQIHEELDSLGAYIDQEISMESAFVNLYCLRQNVLQAFELLISALENVSFEEHEIEEMLQVKKQRYLVSLEKVSFLARKSFQKYFFSNLGSYSRQLELEDFDSVNRQDLIDFHKEFYLKGLRKIVVVSNLQDEVVSAISERLKSWSQASISVFEGKLEHQKGSFHVEKKGAIQTAIRLGIPLFNKKHEDYVKFQVLQTILGDYFGSRLMSNIREDKGYTYGIGCGLVELKETGYFVIATEVGKDVCDATINEIKYEIERLRTELVPHDELSLVKNYLLGQLLKSADGPNAMMDLFLGVRQHQMTLDFYNEYIEKIKAVTSEELVEIAVKYLVFDNFTLVTAGERN
ncbi:MAG: M16 family metallopeptidase [Flavobacteriia bacterium]|jgi:zinc protease